VTRQFQIVVDMEDLEMKTNPEEAGDALESTEHQNEDIDPLTATKNAMLLNRIRSFGLVAGLFEAETDDPQNESEFSPSFSVGPVLCIYDGEYYPAEILEVQSDGRYLVKYDFYKDDGPNGIYKVSEAYLKAMREDERSDPDFAQAKQMAEMDLGPDCSPKDVSDYLERIKQRKRRKSERSEYSVGQKVHVQFEGKLWPCMITGVRGRMMQVRFDADGKQEYVPVESVRSKDSEVGTSWRVGQKVKALNDKNKWVEAMVVKIGRHKLTVKFDGFEDETHSVYYNEVKTLESLPNAEMARLQKENITLQRKVEALERKLQEKDMRIAIEKRNFKIQIRNLERELAAVKRTPQ